jgi:hypothetical protein
LLPLEFHYHPINVKKRSAIVIVDHRYNQSIPYASCWRFYVERLLVSAEKREKQDGSGQFDVFWDVKLANLISPLELSKVVDLSALA